MKLSEFKRDGCGSSEFNFDNFVEEGELKFT